MDQDESPTSSKRLSKSNKYKSSSKKIKTNNISEDGSSSNEMLIVDIESAPIPKTPIKPIIIINNSPKITPSSSSSVTSSNSSNKKRKKRDSASSDEERWLTAIESGKLDDVDDELKKIKPKDPALMTARQRAMYERGGGGGGSGGGEGGGTPQKTSTTTSATALMSLPTGYKEKVMTAEAIQKAAIKSQKRKQLADQKREKDKIKTMERLLKKQDSKATKQIKQSKILRTNAPLIVYKQTCDGTFLNFPDGIEYPLKHSEALEPKKRILCSIKGCRNFKKYSCSKTGLPLCSLQCYKLNLKNTTTITPIS